MLNERLVNQAVLQENESLSSLLYRLSDLNYYQPHGALFNYIHSETGKIIRRQGIEGAMEPILFRVVAVRTGLSELELYNSTIHSYCEILHSPGDSHDEIVLSEDQGYPLLNSKAVLHHIFSKDHTKYCPHCIDEHPYHRLGWMLVGVTMCIRHCCLLLECCSRCGANIRIRDVVYNECGKCGFVLSSAIPLSLVDDALSSTAQRNIQSWFGLCEPSYQDDFSAITGATYQGLYQFLYRLQVIIRGQKRMGGYFHKVGKTPDLSIISKRLPKMGTDTAVIHSLVVTASRALLDWPQGFHKFLRVFRACHEDTLARTTLQKHFSAIYTWLREVRAVPEFQFVQTAFDDFLVDEYSKHYGVRYSARCRQNPGLTGRFTYITYNDACHILGVTGDTITHLTRKGYIERISCVEGGHPLLRQADVVAMNKKWKEMLSAEEACERMGVSIAILKQLVELDVIQIEEGSVVNGDRPWRINERYVEAFLLALEQNAQYWFGARSKEPAYLSVLEREYVDLAEASKKFVAVGGNEGVVLQQVFLGRLPAITLDRVARVNQLRFHRDDVRDCIERNRAWRGRPVSEVPGIEPGIRTREVVQLTMK